MVSSFRKIRRCYDLCYFLNFAKGLSKADPLSNHNVKDTFLHSDNFILKLSINHVDDYFPLIVGGVLFLQKFRSRKKALGQRTKQMRWTKYV